MTNAQINPLFIHMVTGKPLHDIPDAPTISYLPGTYGRLINRNKEQITNPLQDHFFMIKCNTCGRKGKYNVGLMLIDPEYSKQASS